MVTRDMKCINHVATNPTSTPSHIRTMYHASRRPTDIIYLLYARCAKISSYTFGEMRYMFAAAGFGDYEDHNRAVNPLSSKVRKDRSKFNFPELLARFKIKFACQVLKRMKSFLH